MSTSYAVAPLIGRSSKLQGAVFQAPGFAASAALLLLGSAWLTAPGGSGFLFPLDDAYIVLHNARILLSGDADPSYVGIDPLVGATSPVHLALVASFGLVLPLTAASAIVAGLGAAAYAAALVAMARRFGAGSLAATLFAAAGLLAARTPHQLLNGLETGLAMATVAWVLVLVADPIPDRRTRVALWTLCGIAPFIRPELALLVVPACGIDLVRVSRRERSPRKTLAPLLPAMLGALAVTAPFVIWTILATGTPLPGTITAKRAWFAETNTSAHAALSTVVGAVLTVLFQFGGVALAGLMRMPALALGQLGTAFVLALLAVFALALPGGLSHNDHRYLYVAAPVLLFAAASALGAPWALPGPLRRPERYAAALLATSLATAPVFWVDYRAALAVTAEGLAGIADRARRSLPVDARLLVHDAGYVAWATPFQLTDMVGLKTPSSIADHRALTEPSGGARRGEALDAIARRAGATHAVVHDGGTTFSASSPASGRAAGTSVRSDPPRVPTDSTR